MTSSPSGRREMRRMEAMLARKRMPEGSSSDLVGCSR
jgi:hypothetical protein